MIKTTAAIYSFTLCATFFLYALNNASSIPPYIIYNAVCMLFLSFVVLIQSVKIK